jgi:hypothetical protein
LRQEQVKEMISPWKLRDLLDDRLRVTHSGATVYLRMKLDKQVDREFEEYGFTLHTVDADLIDMEIEPPPSVSNVSMHNIGMSDTRLQFGAHQFEVSHTFIEEMMDRLGVTDGYSVWRHSTVVGIMYDGSLFSLESIVPKAANKEIVKWIITGNQQEQRPKPAKQLLFMVGSLASTATVYEPAIEQTA